MYVPANSPDSAEHLSQTTAISPNTAKALIKKLASFPMAI